DFKGEYEDFEEEEFLPKLLYFVGLGLEQSFSLKALKSLRGCDHVYYESYTSPVVNDEIMNELGGLSNPLPKVESVKREFVEDGRKILEAAQSFTIALICSGDPMVATTHQELRIRAIKLGIQTKVMHASSIVSAVGGELGLHSYNFGKMVSMTREPMQYTAYNTIFRNLLYGLHTTILLEWDEASNFFLNPGAAIQSLLDAEKDLRYGIFSEETLLLITSRLGTENARINVLSFGETRTAELDGAPHVLVVPGRLHFTEREALGALFGRNPESFQDNSTTAMKISKIMVSKYSAKTLNALERAREAAATSESRVKFADIFENVECYTQDAQRFLNEGKDELAVLSIGYAEGLLDSLRFGGQLEFEW
ncbi:MAG: diphthine synthase, partial [Nitrososphaerales archaeon]